MKILFSSCVAMSTGTKHIVMSFKGTHIVSDGTSHLSRTGMYKCELCFISWCSCVSSQDDGGVFFCVCDR